MANSRKRTGKQVQTAAPSSPKRPDHPERRKTLKRLRTGALLALGLSGGSFYIGSSVLAGIQEADLSKIGNGVPTIVQIHDPQCPTCRALQREVRQALKQLAADDFQYLVANIRKDDGKALADRHSAQHVTLLLLDGDGKRREVITGLTKSAYLESAFRRHLKRFKKSRD